MRITAMKKLLPLLLLAFVSAASAQALKPVDVAALASQVTEFDVNGLKVIVKRRPSSPTVSAGLFIRGGARNIDAKTAGIEDLMLRVANEAGKKYDRTAVRRELSRTGSGIGSAAGQDYSAVSMGATRPNFDKVWDIFTDVMLEPRFSPDDVERNREVMLSGLREAGVSPEAALESALNRVVYEGHPYANDVNGTLETVASFKAADLAAYHKKVMTTSQLLLVFVGDLDPNDVKAKVTASFGKLPRGTYKAQPLPALNFSKGSLDVTSRPGIPINYVEGVFNAPSLDNPDYYAMQIAMNILQQLVTQEVRNKRQLSYAPAAEMDKSAANTANISVSSGDPNESVRVMMQQIDLIKNYVLREDVISDVAANFLTTYYLEQETSGAQVGDLARYELIGGGWRNSFDFLNRIRDVKAEDIPAVANKYMKNLRFVVVGDPAKIERSVFLPS